MRCRVLVATAIACVFLVGSAHAAGAQGGGNQDPGRRISLTGGLVVASGETVDGPAVSANGPVRVDGRVNGAVYVGRGDLRIDGRVTGDVLVLDGDALIRGRVGGSVTVLNGKATVRPSASVHGDVASRTTPTAARGTVQGHVERLDLNSLFAGFVVVILAVLWVAVTLSTAVLGLLFVWLFPRAADAVVVAGRRVWASFFLGLFVGIIALGLGLLIMVSVVGIPLGFAVLGTLAVLVPLGYVASALIFGRLMVHRSGTGGRIGAFFAGFGILRFGALVPGLGFVIGFFFSTYGFGALLIAGWRAGRRAIAVEELEPEYAARARVTYEEEVWPPYLPYPEPRRRRAAARTTPTRKAGARKTPSRASKSGPRKKTANRRTTGAATTARKSSAGKRSATRARAAPRKRAAKTAKKPAKKTSKKSTAKRPARTTAKKTSKKSTAKQPAKKAKRATTRSATKQPATKRRAAASSANGRATARRRVSANNSRTAKRPRPQRASTNRSGARARD